MFEARQRYEHQIREEEDKAMQFTKTISKLENKEQVMIEKLKKTQTAHAAFMNDLDRINQNQDPEGPLVDLRESLNINNMRKSWQLRMSPKVRVSPKRDMAKKSSPVKLNGQESGSGKKQYGDQRMYNVGEFYR